MAREIFDIYKSFDFHMRSQARLNISIRRAYSLFLQGLARASTDSWPIDCAKASSPTKIGRAEFIEVMGLSRCFCRRVRSSVNFPVREADMPDDKSSDDWMHVEWLRKLEDYETFVVGLLPGLITAFHPYRATLGPSISLANDFPIERKMRLNERYQVFRIWPVDYLNGDLCRSAFGMPPRRCAQLLRPIMDSVEVFEGGLLMRQSGILSPEECDEFNRAARLRLRSSSVGVANATDRNRPRGRRR